MPKSNSKKYKIFMGPCEISEILGRLNSAFTEMNIKSEVFSFRKHKFYEQNTKNKVLLKFYYHTEQRLKSVTVKEKKYWDRLQMIDILLIYIYAILNYNCFLYIFGIGMFEYNWYLRKHPELEFKILKLLGKKMVMMYVGSDSRPQYCDGDRFYEDVDLMYELTKKNHDGVKRAEKYMETIDNPATAHFHSEPFISSFYVRVPVDNTKYVVKTAKKKDKVVVFHAPSNHLSKGTNALREIIAELKEEGYEFEYVELSGVPNKQIIEEFANVDIVVDQLYSDTAMAGLATEAAINGIPVIVGGHHVEMYKKFPDELKPPTIYCDTEDVKSNLARLITDEEERKRVGAAEKAYVEKYNMAKEVAKKILVIFDGNVPQEYYCNPDDYNSIWGFGNSKENVIKNVVSYIDKYGKEGLFLDDKPEFAALYMKLYEENKSSI